MGGVPGYPFDSFDDEVNIRVIVSLLAWFGLR